VEKTLTTNPARFEGVWSCRQRHCGKDEAEADINEGVGCGLTLGVPSTCKHCDDSMGKGSYRQGDYAELAPRKRPELEKHVSIGMLQI
jgi:hypothetical protein